MFHPSNQSIGVDPFHAWKEKFLKTDISQEGYPIRRPRDWYYKAYGNYVNKCRLKAVSSTGNNK